MLDSESLRIRVAVEADAAALAAFAARTFEETFGPHNRAEDLRAHLHEAFGVAQQTLELRNPAMVTLLAHLETRLVAFAQVLRKDPPSGIAIDRPIELHRFYVDRPATVTALRSASCRRFTQPHGELKVRLSGSASGNTIHAPSRFTRRSASSIAAATISMSARIARPIGCWSRPSMRATPLGFPLVQIRRLTAAPLPRQIHLLEGLYLGSCSMPPSKLSPFNYSVRGSFCR